MPRAKLTLGDTEILKLGYGQGDSNREVKQLFKGNRLIYRPDKPDPTILDELATEIGFETQENIFKGNLIVGEIGTEIGFETA